MKRRAVMIERYVDAVVMDRKLRELQRMILIIVLELRNELTAEELDAANERLGKPRGGRRPMIPRRGDEP